MDIPKRFAVLIRFDRIGGDGPDELSCDSSPKGNHDGLPVGVNRRRIFHDGRGRQQSVLRFRWGRLYRAPGAYVSYVRQNGLLQN